MAHRRPLRHPDQVRAAGKDPLTGPDIASRTPFPNNQIPVSPDRQSGRAEAVQQPALYPLPNNPGTGALGSDQQLPGGTASKTSNHQGDAKFDYRPNEKDSYMARWSMGRYDQGGSQSALPVLNAGRHLRPHAERHGQLDPRVFTVRVVNEARVGFSRVGIDDIVIDWSGQLGADGNSKFGIPGGQPIPGLSACRPRQLADRASAAAATIGSTRDNKYTYSDNLTWQQGLAPASRWAGSASATSRTATTPATTARWHVHLRRHLLERGLRRFPDEQPRLDKGRGSGDRQVGTSPLAGRPVRPGRL